MPNSSAKAVWIGLELLQTPLELCNNLSLLSKKRGKSSFIEMIGKSEHDKN
jgi:hypothetical protein